MGRCEVLSVFDLHILFHEIEHLLTFFSILYSPLSIAYSYLLPIFCWCVYFGGRGQMYVYNQGVSFNRYTYFISIFFLDLLCVCVCVHAHACERTFWPLFLDMLFYFLNLLWCNLLMVSVTAGVYIFTFENYEISWEWQAHSMFFNLT